MIKKILLACALALAATTSAYAAPVCEEGNKIEVIEQEIAKLPAEATVKRITEGLIIGNILAELTEKLGPPPFDVSTIDNVIVLAYPNGNSLLLFLSEGCNKSAVTLPTTLVDRILTSI